MKPRPCPVPCWPLPRPGPRRGAGLRFLLAALLPLLPLVAGLAPLVSAETPAAPATPPAPAAPATPPDATAETAEFQPNAVLRDGATGPVLWPGPATAESQGPVWKDPQGKAVPAGQVIRVQFTATPPPTTISQGATTFDGQRVIGSIDAFSEKEGLKITSPALGVIQVPANLLSRVCIQETAAGEEDELPVGLTQPGVNLSVQKDRVVYRNADQSESRLFYLADGAAKLKSGDDIATAPLERLAFMTLAAPAKLPAGDRDLLVLLTDGSRVTGNVAAATPENLTLNSTLGTLKIPRALIHSLWPHQAGYVLLARRQPTAVKNHGQFDVSFPPRINRTAAGKPFQAAEFNLAGIGMHSYTRADYALDGATACVAFVALDGAASAKAACTVRVYVDGAKKFEADLTTGTPGRWISVATAGGKSLALEVDFGADQADPGDLVDWINAILLQ